MALVSSCFVSPLLTMAMVLWQETQTGLDWSWRKLYDEISAVGLAVIVVLLLMSITRSPLSWNGI